MKRLLALLLVLGAAGVGVAGYAAVQQERRFRQLVAEGDAALARDDTYVAIEAYTGAITLKNTSMLAYLRRGETYQRRGDAAAAQRDLRRAAELDPSATRPPEMLGDLQYAQRRYASAAEQYTESVELDDASPRVQYKLGLSLYRAGRAADGVGPLERAVALDEGFAEAHYLHGLVLRDLGKTDAAVVALRRAVSLSPALAQARGELSDLYSDLNRQADALRELDALAALEGRPERQVALGLAYARAGRTERAVVTLGAAVERFPENAAAYVALGRVWLQSAEARPDRVALSKAIEALEGAIDAGANGSEALALLGRAHFLNGHVEPAERILRDAATRLPVDPEVFAYLADAAERLGHADLARRALVSYRALRDDEEREVARVASAARIADLSMRAGDWKEAVVWYRRAAQAAAGDAALLRRLAELEWRTGDVEAARATIARALELAPRDRGLMALAQRFR
ncbi:MAG: tetratricopeptide repeat protein [Vicinamibacterales bacterium]